MTSRPAAMLVTMARTVRQTTGRRLRRPGCPGRSQRLLESVEDQVEAELELAQVLPPLRGDVLLGVLGEVGVAGAAQSRDEPGDEVLGAQAAGDVLSADGVAEVPHREAEDVAVERVVSAVRELG